MWLADGYTKKLASLSYMHNKNIFTEMHAFLMLSIKIEENMLIKKPIKNVAKLNHYRKS
jgi:hypothetical protein